jgi:hypothetical protein
MNAWHHTRKDVRQHRAAISIWLLLLAADALMSCTTVIDANFAEIASMLLVAMIIGLSLAFGWSDSPALGDHFLATRPVSARQLWSSKALTLILVILLPILLQAALVTGWLGLGTTHVGMLARERLLLALPLVTIMLCIGGLEPMRLGFAAGIGPLFGCLGAGLGIGLACHFADRELSYTSLLYAPLGHGGHDARHALAPERSRPQPQAQSRHLRRRSCRPLSAAILWPGRSLPRPPAAKHPPS